MSIISLQKWGNSSGIRIPKNILTELDIKENDKIKITIKGNEIILKKADKETLSDYFADFDYENYLNKEFDWGTKVGKEVW